MIDHVPSYLLAFAALQGKVSLAECAKFWGDAANRTDIREIIDVLSVTGGVPRYLEEIDPGLSAAENIRRMAFRGNGLLRTDFDEMFTDVVTRQPRLSAKALRALAGPPMGVSELADALTTLDALDGWESVMGYAFENLVVNNWPELVRPLHLGRALIESAAPWRRAKAKERLGVQADLLIQTRRALCVVEIKRQREIGREVIDEVAEKVRRIPRREGTSVKTALVYEGHLAPIVEADGYFDAIVPFRQLLGV